MFGLRESRLFRNLACAFAIKTIILHHHHRPKAIKKQPGRTWPAKDPILPVSAGYSVVCMKIIRFFSWVASQGTFSWRRDEALRSVSSVQNAKKKKNKLSCCCNISNMRRSVSSPDETPRRELKIRRAAEYFWRTSRYCVECLIFLLKQNHFWRRNQGCKNEQFFIWYPNTH